MMGRSSPFLTLHPSAFALCSLSPPFFPPSPLSPSAPSLTPPLLPLSVSHPLPLSSSGSLISLQALSLLLSRPHCLLSIRLCPPAPTAPASVSGLSLEKEASSARGALYSDLCPALPVYEGFPHPISSFDPHHSPWRGRGVSAGPGGGWWLVRGGVRWGLGPGSPAPGWGGWAGPWAAGEVAPGEASAFSKGAHFPPTSVPSTVGHRALH